jgi:integrase
MPGYRLVRYRGIWCVYWREQGRARRSSLGTPDRELAERRFAVFQAAQATPARPKTVLVADCLAAYYEAKPQVIPRKALAWFGKMLPTAIDQGACHRYAAERRAAPKTIHTEMGVLRAALTHAERLRWIDRAPFIWMPDPGEPRERWLSHEEADRLLAECHLPHLKLYVQIGLHAPARPGAILDLTWPQVSFAVGVINFNPPGRARTAKGRAVVPMTAELRAVLEAAQEARTDDCAYVVNWAGRRVTKIRRAFEAACRRAKLEGVTPHTLRHTAATWMAEGGVDMRKISRYLGHSRTEVTERVYAKHSPDFLKDAADALAQFSLVQVNTLPVNKAATGSGKGRKRPAKDQ